jgi:hypothetical protein
LLVVRFELKGGREFRFGQRGIFFGDSNDASELMIFHAAGRLSLDSVEHLAGEVKLTKSHRSGGERNLVGRDFRFE